MITPSPDDLAVFAACLAAAEPLGAVVRVAGGWVRDALLGERNNTDMDLVVEGTTAKALCDSMGGAAGVSAAMACVTMSVCGRPIDVTHTADITADALRRDFTVNALFYNLSTRLVEDPTGRGVADVADRILRCPLMGDATLRNDPLRVLRAVRFMHLLRFRLDDSVIVSDAVRCGLRDGVARERIGVEIVKTFSSSAVCPTVVFETYRSMGIVESIFRKTWTTHKWEEGLRMASAGAARCHTPEGRVAHAVASLIVPTLSALDATAVPHAVAAVANDALRLPKTLAVVRVAVALLQPPSVACRYSVFMWMRGLAGWGDWRALVGADVVTLVESDATLLHAPDLAPAVRGDVLAKELGLRPDQISAAVGRLLRFQVEEPGLGKEAWLARMRE